MMRVITGLALGMLATTLHAQPYELEATVLEYEAGILNASGGVTGRFDTAEIRADELQGNTETGELRVRGNVSFKQDDLVWFGDELTYNYLSRVGVWEPIRLEMNELILRAETMRQTGPNSFQVEQMKLTGCRWDTPLYHLYAPEAALHDNEVVEASHLWVKWGEIPVLYLPYWRQSLNASSFYLRGGYRSNLGLFSAVGFKGNISDQVESETYLHAYSKRGVGIEQQFQQTTEKYTWKGQAFYLHDQSPYERYGLPEERAEIDTERFRLKFDMEQVYTPTHYTRLKSAYWSDPYIQEEFFRGNFAAQSEAFNQASWVYGGDHFAVEGYAKQHLFDVDERIDRVEVALDVYDQPLSDRWYYASTTEAAYLSKWHVLPVAEEDELGRFITAHKLSMPMQKGVVRVVPRVEAEATYYSQRQDTSIDNLRHGWLLGLESSIRGSRLLTEKSGWYGEGLRHTLKPYLDYQLADYSTAVDLLGVMDQWDRREDVNRVKMGVQHRLQTRRQGKVTSLAEVDVYTHYTIGALDTNQTRFEDLYVDGRLQLNKRWTADAWGRMDLHEHKLSELLASIRYHRPNYTVSVEHLYRDNLTSLVTIRGSVFPQAAFSLEGWVRQNMRGDAFAAGSLMLYYNNSCCLRYGLGYQQLRTDEHQFRLSVELSQF